MALRHYQAAIDILSVKLKGKDRTTNNRQNEETELKNSIVRALIGQVEIWMDPSYDLWFVIVFALPIMHAHDSRHSFEPNAEKTCEDLLSLALQTDPGNSEALQASASVRMSQQRPDDAKECLEKAWSVWKDLDLGSNIFYIEVKALTAVSPDDPNLPPIPTRLTLVKLFLELSLYTPALLVLHGIMASDDQEVEAWYLEGWCFFLMSEEARENDGKLDELTWQELAKDARDCLETCQVVRIANSRRAFFVPHTGMIT